MQASAASVSDQLQDDESVHECSTFILGQSLLFRSFGTHKHTSTVTVVYISDQHIL